MRSCLIGYYGPAKKWYWVNPVNRWAFSKPLQTRTLKRIIKSNLIVGTQVIDWGHWWGVVYHLARR